MKTVILPKEYNYDFKLPYTDLTKSYIKRMRSKGFKIRLRGSGERAKWSLKETNGRSARIFDSHIPLKYASWVRLYITKGTLNKTNKKPCMSIWSDEDLDFEKWSDH